MDFGAKVKSILKLRGMTIKELAQVLSMTDSSLYKKLDGRIPVTIEEACKIANVLEVPLSQLCEQAYTRAEALGKAIAELKEVLAEYLEEKK
jgi:transcriptional regulator with XRE-family HTH domain